MTPMTPMTPNLPKQVRNDLADTLEDIGQAMALLRESSEDLAIGNEAGAILCASDALEIISSLAATFDALTARLAIFSEQ